MQISCRKCKALITVPSGSIPKFCSECGASLSPAEPAEPDSTLRQTAREAEAWTVTRRPSPELKDPEKESPSQQGQREIGPYRLVRQLGQGGMGSVFEAIHQETGQPVALKLLIPSLQGTDESIQRFRRESQIAASLNHPRSTFVYGAGEHEGQFYITMELMEGGTLKDIVATQGPVETGRAIDYILDIIDGLQAAHSEGIVHRDLKPSNCFLDREGRVKVGDYGLAKSFLGDSQLTQTGAFMGTPQYAAPEQLLSGDIDERVDIYALGATLFYLLAGQPCFRGSPAQVIASIASETPPKVSEFTSRVPRALVRIIAQTMEKDPNRRPQSLKMLREMLLPYSTRGASLADVGRRIAAFFVDMTMVQIINSILIMGLLFLGAIAGISQLNPMNPNKALVWIVVPIGIAYFALCEHYFGRGIGKWLMGMRVIGGDSESPSLAAAILRALILPGLSFLVSALAGVLWLNDPFPSSQNFQSIAGQQTAIQLLSSSLMLICMATARRSGGYRGIHELLSGTRVVRLSGELEFRRIESFPITVPVRGNTEKVFGNYRVIGRFESNLKPVPYLGMDPKLERDVWIYDELPPLPGPETDRYSTRARRLRMIHDARQSGQDWCVTEAVKGGPLVEILQQTDCNWQAVRPVLLELVIELRDSVAQGMLPVDLDIHHVWLDETGRIKLLEFPVVTARLLNLQGIETTNESDTTKDKISNSPSRSLPPENRLLIQLLSRFIQHHEVPLHVRRLLKKLRERGEEPSMLAYLETELSESADRPANWNWDDRLGVLAVAGGIEVASIFLLVNVVGMACFTIAFHWLSLLVVPMLIGGLATFMFGYCFNGGLALRLSEVAVLRQKDLQPASKWRCGARNALACLPFVLFASWGAMIITSMSTFEIEPRIKVGLMLLGNLLILLLCGCIGLNIIISLLNPARNMIDYLAGTRLSRQ